MSQPLYKDFDKSARDLFSDDFDTKNSIKVKSAAPAGVTLTTTTDCSCGASAFSSKVAAKWAHASGFAVDKFEVAGCDKVKLETSLTGLAPGLKFDFKGASASSGNLGVTYKHANASVATNLDIAGFSSASASVLGGANGFTAGVAGNFALAGKFDVKDFSAVVGYAPNATLFTGVGASKKFTEFNVSLKFDVKPEITIAALADIVPKTSSHKFQIGAAYTCNPDTTVKVKVNSDGVINASVKQKCQKKFEVIGAAEFDTRNTSSIKFGVNATLG